MGKTTTNPTATCLKSNLNKALSFVGKAVAKNSNLPVLGNVMLAVTNGRLSLSATNLEIALTTQIGAKAAGEWSITLPFKPLSDHVAALPDDTITLEYLGKTQAVRVTCQTFVTTFKGIDAQEFPTIPNVDKPAFSLRGGDAASAIKRVLVTAATDDARPILTGVLIRGDGEQITLAASDGFRVSEAKIKSDQAKDVTMIIPARWLKEFSGLVANDDDMVDVQLYGLKSATDRVGFRRGDMQMVIQLIEGKFPKYEEIIPKTTVTRVVVSTSQIRQLCKIADIIAAQNAHTARVTVRPASDDKKNITPGVFELTAAAAETGDHISKIDAVVDGPELQAAFNVKFLKDVLENCETPNTAFQFVDATSPAVIRPVGVDDYMAALMPMHLGR